MSKSAAPIRTEKDLGKLLPSEPRLFPRIADMELKRGSAKAAAKIVVKGLQQLPDSVSGWIVKGNMHLQLKQAKFARTAFEKALQIDQDIPFAHRQCADLAAEEGDQEGYLYHLRHLARLETLDENVQTMLQTALLREAAVKSGIYSRESVSRVMPGALRQALLRAGALPEEIARRAERFEFPEEVTEGNGLDGEYIPREEPPNGREKLAWEEPKAVEEIRKKEKESRDTYVRVSWADAVTDESTQPLVEIGPEQFEPSEEEELNSITSQDGAPLPPDVTQTAVSADRSTASAVAGDDQIPREPMVKPYVHKPGKLEMLDTALPQDFTTSIEDEWEGATPQPPMIEAPPPKAVPTPPAPVEQTVATPSAPRFKLPPDMVLPDRRPLELDDDSSSRFARPVMSPPPSARADMSRVAPYPTSEHIEPKREAPRPVTTVDAGSTAIPKTVERPVAPPEPGKIPRDDSSIMRLLSAERDKKPAPPKAPISELLTRFEAEDSQSKDTPAVPSARARFGEMVAKPPQLTSLAPSESEELEASRSTPRSVIKPVNLMPSTPEVESQGGAPNYVHAKQVPSLIMDNEDAVPKSKVLKASPPPPPVEPMIANAIVDDMPKTAEIKKTSKFDRPQPETSPAKEESIPVESKPQVASPAAATPADDEPMQKSPEVLAREAEAREKLVAIAREVTGKMSSNTTQKTPPPPQTTRPAPAPAASDAKDGDKGKAKIATKTLAELYASQGDWARAVEVYEALLEKFPTNEAYKRRLDALRSKLSDN